jgi:hypothetical protein
LSAALYVWDENNQKSIQGLIQPLYPGEWQELQLSLPAMHGACLSQAGIVLRNVGDEVWNGSVLLDELDWEGSPNYSDDFANTEPAAGSIQQWTYLRGYWRLQDGAYHGSGPDLNESYTGDIRWSDLTLRVRLVPLLGETHNINIRVQGALCSYALGLASGNRLVFYKNQGGYRTVDQAPFAWSLGETYWLWIRSAGPRLLAGTGDQTLIDWTDGERPYLHGQIGLSNFPGCHTRFEEFHVG